MHTPSKIVIGIQARSTSKRLPRKVHMPINGKAMLQHVIDACTSSAWHSSKYMPNVNIETWVLCPYGDEIATSFNIPIFEGPEDDVLTRYVDLCKATKADYMVRVTGDCPVLPSFIISKVIKCIIKEYNPVFKNYASNVLERTEKEGFDVEVISRNLLYWLDQECTDPEDREHVTLLIKKLYDTNKKAATFPLQRIHVIDKYDQTHIATSVNTADEYRAICAMINSIEERKQRILSRGDKYVWAT